LGAGKWLENELDGNWYGMVLLLRQYAVNGWRPLDAEGIVWGLGRESGELPFGLEE
jgi:hypothetical protein